MDDVPDSSPRSPLGRSTAWIPWLLRLLWVLTAVTGSAAISGAVDERSSAVAATATWGAAVGWVLGVAAMAVPATTSLTATRVIVPAAVPVAVLALAAGAPATAGSAFVGTALAAAFVAASADLGQAFVQASAYGDEQRFLLRPPLGFGIAAVLAWTVWVALVISGPLSWAAGVWPVGAPVSVLAVVVTVVLARRWHLLSRRWLVLVPAGLVLHDQVVLGETVMLRRQQIERIALAPADTDALDLTGPSSGHAIEVSVRQPVTVLLPPSPAHPNGRAFHVTAFLAGPSRPGRALAAANERRLPVG